MLFNCKRATIAIICFFFLAGLMPALGSADSADDEFFSGHEYSGVSNTTITVFYNKYCSACHRAIPIIEEINKKYPKVTTEFYDTYDSTANLTLLYDYADYYGISYPAYPIVFAGDSIVLQGTFSINENLEDVLKALDSGAIPDIEYEKKWTDNGEEKEEINSKNSDEITILIIAVAGLIDGINPCAFAVLIFLLISLLSAKSRINLLVTGIFYIFAVFLFYILAGVGLMSFVRISGITYYFGIFAGIIAIFAGIINISDGILKNSSLSLSIPKNFKDKLGKTSRNISIPVAFILGLMVGIFELPCTGGIYLAVISLISSEMTLYQGLPYLVLYNFFFVLPLILITVAVYFGMSPKVIDRFRITNKKIMKVAMGAILIFIGIAVLLFQI